ncbi:MAG: Crp/Fnr family transcriptional regulator [Propionibacteriales bacterium]|nr:Crp/Fnr family transcriptional regulator [Propionibacteriales bacterium]
MSDIHDLLARVPLLQSANAAELKTLAVASNSRRLRPGQVLVVEGQPSDFLFVVIKGRLKVTIGSPDGESLVLAFIQPGESLGEVGLIDGGARSASVEATEPTEVVCVPASACRDLMMSSAAVSFAAAEELAARLRNLTGSAADIVFLDVPRRVAKALLAGAVGDVFATSQTEIAQQVGASRASVNRALAQFQRHGWLSISRNKVTISDRLAIEAFLD